MACRNPTCGRAIHRRVTDTKWEFCSKRCRSQFLYVKNGMKDKLVSKDFTCTLSGGSELTVRSRWEAAFIKDYLEPRGFNWEYESKIIDLPDGRKYIPDFYIAGDSVFVEVKGFERGPSLEKVREARKLGYHVIYADHKTLTGVFGLDLSSGHLASIARATV